MNLSDCIAALKGHKRLPELIEAAKKHEKPTASKAERRAALDQLPALFGSNDHRTAVATTLALVLADPDTSIAKIRKEGLFRSSRYAFDAGCLKKVVPAALAVATAVNAPQERLDYLQSVMALLEMAQSAEQIRRSILQRLSLRRSGSVKTLLAIVNYMFAIHWQGDREQDASIIERWSATELASAFSRLYMMIRNDSGIRRDTYYATDDLAGGVHEIVYQSLLADAATLNELIDAEVMIDGLPYRAETAHDGVLISAIDPEFERSVRLGYMQTEYQYAVRMFIALEENQRRPRAASYKETMQAILDAGLLQRVQLRLTPAERLVFEMPDLPPLFEALSREAVFIEEYPLIEGAHRDNFHPEGAGFLQISDTLTTIDLFKVQRLFNLIEMAFQAKLATIEDKAKRHLLLLRSTVMVMPRPALQLILEKILAPAKVNDLLSLLALATAESARGSDHYFDLQYQPFLQAIDSPGDYVAIAPSVVAMSNLVRTVQTASEIKKRTDAKDDPMQRAVVTALQRAGFLTKDSFEFNIDGKRETDIFAYRDGVLFVLECKNAYHPCSPHELRNSYDLVQTAQTQLDIRAAWLAVLANQAKLFQAMSWHVPPTARVYTCTVTANRLFTGYQNGAHPVRQALELINVLESGQVRRGPHEPPLRFWRAATFQVDDFIDYLEGNALIAQHHAAMEPVVRTINVRGKTLAFSEYSMDLEKAAESMAQTFTVVEEQAGAHGSPIPDPAMTNASCP